MNVPRRLSLFLTATALVLVGHGLSPSSGLESSRDGAAPARARTFAVTAVLAPLEVVEGGPAVLSGKVSPARDGKVTVQEQTGSGWTSVATRRLNDEGRYRYAFTATGLGEHTYRVRMPRVGRIRAGVSPSRTLSVVASDVVVFHIPSGTQLQSWNTSDTRVVATVGQTLRIVNDDSWTHSLHTDGDPFAHGESIAPGASVDYELVTAHDSDTDGPLYCHAHGTSSDFWIDVLPADSERGGQRP